MNDAIRQESPEQAEAGSFVDLLRIEELDKNLFRGHCHAGAPLRAFGGQVAAQALTAAGRTMTPGRLVHSLHSYFLRPGDPRKPIDYQVDRVRDGFSYATRRVTAVQRDEVIFTLSASFKVPEATPQRHRAMPPVPAPEDLPDPFADWRRTAPQDPERASALRTLQMRFVPADAPGMPAELPGVPQQFVWLRTGTPLPQDDPLLQVCALTYLSDLTLASTTALHLQGDRAGQAAAPRVQLASLDHAMWFHRPFRADEWLLFAQRSPSAGDGRGLALGEFYDRSGELVASAVQEALLRQQA
ncbi:acyl-CoA thioesterase II [Kitasatospora kazusensis]|uniref:Acyl-CoA thioesterase II n=1 Tax=Kitasatospora kazusensis TaxID=407974 RepID=A0ABP5LQE3_9ACTN